MEFDEAVEVLRESKVNIVVGQDANEFDYVRVWVQSPPNYPGQVWRVADALAAAFNSAPPCIPGCGFSSDLRSPPTITKIHHPDCPNNAGEGE